MYRYELQYHDMEPTQMAPGRIRQYPQNLALQSIMGQNLAHTAWDVLAAKQQQGHEAMQRDEQIRMLSMQTGVPEVQLHAAAPPNLTMPPTAPPDEPAGPPEQGGGVGGFMDDGFMDSDSTADRYPPAAVSGATSSVSSSANRSYASASPVS